MDSLHFAYTLQPSEYRAIVSLYVCFVYCAVKQSFYECLNRFLNKAFHNLS